MLFVTAVTFCIAIVVKDLENVKFHSVLSRFVSNTLLVPYGKCGSPYLGKAAAAARAALPTSIGECSIFVCLDNGTAASV